MTTLVKHDGFRFLNRDDPEATGHMIPVGRQVALDVWRLLVAEPARWFGRVALRFADWVDRNVVTVVAVFTALTGILSACVLLLLYKQQFLSITVGMVGVVVVTAVVAYRAGASRG